ncbi:hypothetical protein OSTOST_11437 [Ostertagia ostertagi]
MERMTSAELDKFRCVTEWFGIDDEEMSDGEENNDPLLFATGPPKKRKITDAPDDEPPKLIPTAHYRLVYGGNSLFLFFRVHQMICDRLGKMKMKHAEQMKDYEEEQAIAAMQAELYKIHGKGFGSHELNASDTNNGLAIIKSPRRSPASNYADLLCEIKSLLDGNIDPNTYEDNVRLLFPIDGYLVTTIDKLIAMVGRQLHFLAQLRRLNTHDAYKALLNVVARLFLRRISSDPCTGDFIAFGGDGAPSILSPSFGWEGIIRRNRGRGLAKMERMHYIRKCRAGDMFAEEHGVTWLAKGMQKVTSHHPVYEFLQFNKYMLKNIAYQSRSKYIHVS